MSADSYTQVSSRSWGSRLMGAMAGMLIGLVLVIGAIGLLSWNEGRAVKRARALDEGLGQVVSVVADRVDAANEGQLIHVSGLARTDQTLTDPEFGVSGVFLKLKRTVEMYQWRESSHSETREKLGGGTETVTTYTYERAWAAQPISSSGFHHPEGHANPGAMPYAQWQETASQITLGAYRLAPAQVGRINDYRPLSLRGLDDSASQLRVPDGGQVVGDEVYVGDNSAEPRIGDVRIGFKAVQPHEISLVAVQQGNSFVPWRASNGGDVSLLDIGRYSAQEMFAAAQQRNTVMTWGLRLLGLVLMFIGIRMLFGVIRVLAAVVPLLGRLVGGALGLVSAILALILALITVAIAWLVYRPLIGAGLLAVAAILVLGLRLARQPDATQTAPASASGGRVPPPPPPPPA